MLRNACVRAFSLIRMREFLVSKGKWVRRDVGVSSVLPLLFNVDV